MREFDQERKGYAFTNGDRIKKLTLSDSELLVLLAASEAVSHLLSNAPTSSGHSLSAVGKFPGRTAWPSVWDCRPRRFLRACGRWESSARSKRHFAREIWRPSLATFRDSRKLAIVCRR